MLVLDIAGRDAESVHLLQRLLQVRDGKAKAGIAVAGDHRSGRHAHEFDEHAIEIEARDVVLRKQREPEGVAIEGDGCFHVGDVVEDGVEGEFQLAQRLGQHGGALPFFRWTGMSVDQFAEEKSLGEWRRFVSEERHQWK